MSFRTLYSIKYTNRLTGERCTYMYIGFETQERAQTELNLLLREQKKQPYTTEELLRVGSQFLRSWMIGTEWKIEPIKCKLLQNGTT